MSWRKANFFAWLAAEQTTDLSDRTRETAEATTLPTANKQVKRDADGKAYASTFVGDVQGNVTGNVVGDLEGTASISDKLGSPGYFVSDIITGTAEAQSTPHGLVNDDDEGVIPAKVWVGMVKCASEGDEITPGVHTTTNCIFTAPVGCKYQIVAFK